MPLRMFQVGLVWSGLDFINFTTTCFRQATHKSFLAHLYIYIYIYSSISCWKKRNPFVYAENNNSLVPGGYFKKSRPAPSNWCFRVVVNYLKTSKRHLLESLGLQYPLLCMFSTSLVNYNIQEWNTDQYRGRNATIWFGEKTDSRPCFLTQRDKTKQPLVFA